jgi:tetraprenyl-beta-curcumene synthase
MALVAVLAAYWGTVFAVVRNELTRWRALASTIPDPCLRALALDTLEQEGGLAEGAAIFATLVPGWTARRQLVRLLVAWQVAYDYLDTLGERLAAPQASDAARLYAALGAALDPAVRYDGHAGDGGYLDGLVACCRASVTALPSLAAIGPFAVRAAERCAQAQALTHAAEEAGPDALRRWALAQPGTDGFLWWEVAAGAISSLAVHALLATAALPHAAAIDAARVDAAYFPSICALSTLLDSTIDTPEDAGTANHRSTAYYRDAEHAAERVVAVTRIAAAAARALPRGRGHAVILTGMTAYYAAAGWTGSEQTHRRVASAVGPGSGPLLWTLRLRAALGRAHRLRVHVGDRCGDGGHASGIVTRARTHPPTVGDSAETASAGGGARRGVRGLATSHRDNE